MEEIDVLDLMPKRTERGREIIVEMESERLILYVPRSRKWGGGKESKRIVLKRFLSLDDLFFEGLGLWVGEGGKSKGLYFGNTCPEILSRFLDFSREKLGIDRAEFKVTLNTPLFDNNTTKKWSRMLKISIKNFTALCIDPRINLEYAQLYINSIILAKIMKELFNAFKPIILANEKFASAFLRGLFAAEGQVELKKSGVLFYISFSSIDENLITLIKKCFEFLKIHSGKYMPQSRKFPIYGYRNLKRFKDLGIHTLHPEKRVRFEQGFASYRRTNVMDGEEARKLILQQLASGPKTYDELAAALGKARTTIQAHHIPILEKQGLVGRARKRGAAWLWEVEPKAENSACPQTPVLHTTPTRSRLHDILSDYHPEAGRPR